MPALLAMERGKGAFDHARAETQATRGQQGLGLAQISEQALDEARQVVGGHDGKLIESSIQDVDGMGETEAIRIKLGLQSRLMHPSPHGIVSQKQPIEFLIDQFR